MEYLKSTIPIIESNYNNFTNVEKNIADYFMSNEEKSDFSAKAVSRKLFVSEASLSRFAKKCGFRGYREFIYQYEKALAERSTSIKRDTTNALNVYQELLNKTYSLIDEEQILRICRYLEDAARVFVCGKGSSGLVAKEMESRFMRIGVDIDSTTDTDTMRFQTVFQDEKCLAIGISVSGESKGVLYFLREAHARNAKTVLITAQKKDEFEDFCDEVIGIASLKYLSSGYVISPQFPILVMVDIIYSYFVSIDRSKIELRDSTLQALNAPDDGKHIIKG